MLPNSQVTKSTSRQSLQLLQNLQSPLPPIHTSLQILTPFGSQTFDPEKAHMILLGQILCLCSSVSFGTLIGYLETEEWSYSGTTTVLQIRYGCIYLMLHQLRGCLLPRAAQVLTVPGVCGRRSPFNCEENALCIKCCGREASVNCKVTDTKLNKHCKGRVCSGL